MTFQASPHMKLGFVLIPILISLTHGIFFGVFEGSIPNPHQDKITTSEHVALSWLVKEVFYPSEHLVAEEDGTNRAYLEALCQELVDLSHPFDVEHLISAWFNSDARNWTVDEVLRWLGTDPERSSLLSILARNQVDGQGLPSLLVSESVDSDHVSIATEDLLWLKGRIASLILFGPPPPNTVRTALTVSTGCSVIVLITSLWLLRRQLTISHRARLRLSHHFGQIRDSLDQLRTSLDSVQLLVSSNLKNSTVDSDSKLSNLSRMLWQSIEDEIGLIEEVSNFMEGTANRMDADAMFIPSICVWSSSEPSTEKLEWLASVADRMQLRVRDLAFRLSKISSPSNSDSLGSHNLSSQSPASQRIPKHTLPMQDKSCVSVQLAKDGQNICNTSPSSPLKTPMLHVPHQEYHPISSFPLTATSSCSAPASDNEVSAESDTVSDGSPNENRPALRFSEANGVGHKSFVTGTKIPQPRRFSAQTLTPSFFVMNPPVSRWDTVPTNLITPSHIPVGKRKPLTVSNGATQSHCPTVSAVPELQPGSIHPRQFKM